MKRLKKMFKGHVEGRPYHTDGCVLVFAEAKRAATPKLVEGRCLDEQTAALLKKLSGARWSAVEGMDFLWCDDELSTGIAEAPIHLPGTGSYGDKTNVYVRLRTENDELYLCQHYYEYVRAYYPDAELYAENEGRTVKFVEDGQVVALLSPMTVSETVEKIFLDKPFETGTLPLAKGSTRD